MGKTRLRGATERWGGKGGGIGPLLSGFLVSRGVGDLRGRGDQPHLLTCALGCPVDHTVPFQMSFLEKVSRLGDTSGESFPNFFLMDEKFV